MAQRNGRRPPVPPVEPLLQLLQKPPASREELLVHIKGLGKLITSYVQEMSQIDKRTGLSEEAKARAITAFYEQLARSESRLRSIHEAWQLE
jgi:hypothetical protein